MSDAIKIAKEAPKHVEGLLAEMFAAKAEDNRICLGGVYSGPQYIQIQLVVTSNPAELMDDDQHEDGELAAEEAEERAFAREELANCINTLFSCGLYDATAEVISWVHEEAETLSAGDAYFLREGIDNATGLLARLTEFATAPNSVDMRDEASIFSDTPEIATYLYGLNCEGCLPNTEELADRLLALYGLLLEVNRLEVQA